MAKLKRGDVVKIKVLKHSLNQRDYMLAIWGDDKYKLSVCSYHVQLLINLVGDTCINAWMGFMDGDEITHVSIPEYREIYFAMTSRGLRLNPKTKLIEMA